jgi:hypothetical protein
VRIRFLFCFLLICTERLDAQINTLASGGDAIGPSPVLECVGVEERSVPGTKDGHMFFVRIRVMRNKLIVEGLRAKD